GRAATRRSSPPRWATGSSRPSAVRPRPADPTSGPAARGCESPEVITPRAVGVHSGGMDVELAEVRDFLARCAPFDELPGDVLDRLPARLGQRSHRRGTVIIDAGAANDTLHIIRTGAVEVCDPDGALLDARDEG